MSTKTKKFFKKLLSWSGLFFFALAAGMLYWQLRKYSLYDIWHSIIDLPLRNLIWATIAAFVGYMALSLYDFLALRYVGKMVSWWKWMLAGILGFAISNNAGHAVVSGGAIRYRLYTRWRIRGGDIIKIMTFNGFTYLIGCAAVVIAGYFMVPRSLFEQTTAANIGIHALFIFCAAIVGAYFAMTVLFRNKKIHIAGLDFKIPSTGFATAQTIIGMSDIVLAGLVLYFCLIPIPGVDIAFTTFIGLFVIAMVSGVFSQVPGGIGVFEGIFMVALPTDASRASIFAALLAFRIIYYVLPLIGAGGLFFIYEGNLRVKMKRWMAEAKEKAKQEAKKIADKAKNIGRK